MRIPGANEEYLIYQTLIGAWPMDAIDADLTDAARDALRTRINDYMTKALREAKLHTSWINVNAPYERGIAQFIDLLLQPTTADRSSTELRTLRARHPAARRSATRSPRRCSRSRRPACPTSTRGPSCGTCRWSIPTTGGRSTSPPGARCWPSSSNAETPSCPACCAELLRQPGDGRVKLLVTARALRHRRLNRARYDRGDYVALSADGEHARHVVAFARTLDGTASLTVVGRLFASLAADGKPPVGEASWGDTRVVLPPTLPQGAYRDVLTGSVVELDRSRDTAGIRLAQAFANLPVAILEPT